MSFETGLDRRDMIVYPAEPRPESLPLDEQYSVRADLTNANLRAICEAIGKVLFTGIMCEDGGHYGASNSTHCRLTLPSDYTELNDKLHIGDGTREWEVDVSVVDAIEFSDAELTKGSSGGNDYDTIQPNLHFWTVAKEKLTNPITKNLIVLGDFPDALDGNSIRVVRTASQTIKAKLDLFDVEHEADGVHSDGIIHNNNVDKDDMLISQGNVNRVKNGAFNINGIGVLDYWEQLGTPPTLRVNSNVCGTFPDFECEIETDAISEGIRQRIYNMETSQPMRMCLYAKGNTGGEQIQIMLNDDSGNSFQNITLTTTWTIYYLTFTPTSQCNIYTRVVSNTSGTQTFFVALMMVAMGDIHTYPERPLGDAVLDAILTKTFFAQTTVYTADQVIAKWTLEKGCKIENAKAYVITAVAGANLVVRLSDGSNNFDTQISSGNNEGENVSHWEFADGSDMEVIILGNVARTNGLDLTIVYQYRTI